MCCLLELWWRPGSPSTFASLMFPPLFYRLNDTFSAHYLKFVVCFYFFIFYFFTKCVSGWRLVFVQSFKRNYAALSDWSVLSLNHAGSLQSHFPRGPTCHEWCSESGVVNHCWSLGRKKKYIYNKSASNCSVCTAQYPDCGEKRMSVRIRDKELS